MLHATRFQPLRLIHFSKACCSSHHVRYLSWLNRRQDNQNIAVQHVKLRKWWTTKRLINTAISTGILLGYLRWLLSDVEISFEILDGEEEQVDGEEVAEVSPNQEAQEIEQDLSDEDAMFIPLTWANKLPREYYKASDPEWKAFRELAKDKDKIKNISAQLSEKIIDGLKHSPMIAHKLGPNLVMKHYWYETYFPYGPPQEYARKGLAIGSNFVALAEETIQYEQYHRWIQTLLPVGTLKSIYSFYDVLVGYQIRKLKAALGMDVTLEPGTKAYKLDRLLQLVQAHQEAKKSDGPKIRKSHGPMSSVSDPLPSSDTQSDTHQSVAPQRSGRGNSSDSLDDPTQPKWYMPNALFSSASTVAERTVATMVFATTIAGNKTTTPTEPPRGHFTMHGVCQVGALRGAMMLDVLAFVDAKTHQFHTLQVTPRGSKPWKQTPRGR